MESVPVLPVAEILVVTALVLLSVLAIVFLIYQRAPSRKTEEPGGPDARSLKYAPTIGERELQRYRREKQAGSP